MTQFGMYSETTPRNDASPGRGQWDLADAYRYISEAYGGYHLDVMNGINIQAGIFMSYVGLWSYYNFDNWTYQPSYVSSNTPVVLQRHARPDLPLRQAQDRTLARSTAGSRTANSTSQPGVGPQILWRPIGAFTFLGNHYYGTDVLGLPDRMRVHTDDSVMAKYYENRRSSAKMAASLTIDAGCEWGGSGGTANDERRRRSTITVQMRTATTRHSSSASWRTTASGSTTTSSA